MFQHSSRQTKREFAEVFSTNGNLQDSFSPNILKAAKLFKCNNFPRLLYLCSIFGGCPARKCNNFPQFIHLCCILGVAQPENATIFHSLFICVAFEVWPDLLQRDFHFPDFRCLTGKNQADMPLKTLSLSFSAILNSLPIEHSRCATACQG